MSLAFRAARAAMPSSTMKNSDPKPKPPGRPLFLMPGPPLVEAGRLDLLHLVCIRLAQPLQDALGLQGLLLVDLAEREADVDQDIVPRRRSLFAGQEPDVDVSPPPHHLDLGDLPIHVDDLEHLARYRQAHVSLPPPTLRTSDCGGPRRRPAHP